MRAAGSSALRTSIGARANGSGEHTANPWVANRRARSSNKGRIPITSGCRTSPMSGMPSGRAWMASTAAPSAPLSITCSTSTSYDPATSSAMFPLCSLSRSRVPATNLDVALQDGGLGQSREALLDCAGPGVAHSLDLGEVGEAGPHDLLQVRKPRHHVIRNDLG